MTRRCGECTLCCKLLPVRELKKVAGERCVHQRGVGCKVYHDQDRLPSSCALWSCRWLSDEENTAALARPDRSHVVIDVMPDFIQIQNNDTGEITTIPVVQIWVDPAHRDAHHDPALRAYLYRLAETTGTAALIRYNSGEGFTLFAPPMATDGAWHEICGEKATTEHTAAEIAQALAGPKS